MPWIIVKEYGDTNPTWAISSIVATSDPQVNQSRQNLRGRISNTLLGCAVCPLVLAAGHTEWELPFALASTVLLSSCVVRVPTVWRQAPITATIVVAGSLQQNDKRAGVEHALRRLGEVLSGRVVGIAVAWVLSKVWPLREPALPVGK